MFRGRDRDLFEVWSLVRFYVSLCASVLKLFCYNSLGNILLNWNPSFSWGIFVG